MKLSRLMVLSALWLTGLGANAADLIERVAPEAPATIPSFVDGLSLDQVAKSPATFQVGKNYVLYNVGEQTYFSQGCAWATQACASATVPIVVNFYLPEGKTLADATLLMRDYNLYTNAWNNVFFDSETAMFTDRGSQANIYFQVIDQGANTYRIQASEANPSLKPSAYAGFVGRDLAVTYSGDNNGRTVAATDAQPLSPFLDESEGHYIDWQFFELPELSDWEDYFQALDIFNKSEELKKVIGDAEAAGVDVTAAVAVYNDLISTVAQMQAAIEDLSKAITEGAFSGFTPGKVLDVTSLIVNPDFAGDNLSGWSGSGWGSYGPKENAERFSMTFDTYQDIMGLKAGLYVAGVNAFYRAGNSTTAYTNFKAQNEESKYAKFYFKAGENEYTTDVVSPYEGAPTAATGQGNESSAKDEITGVTYYIPNNMVAAEYYMHSLGLYKNSVFANIPAGQARIGLKKETTTTDDWVICDDFSLIYCGEGEQAYQAYVNYYRDNMFPDYEALRVDAADPFTTTSGVNCSDMYIEAFKKTSVTATDEASARAAMAALESAFEPLRQNVSLWTEFLNTAKKAAAVGDDASLNQQDPVVEEVGDWGKYLASETWNARELSNEQLRALIDEMEAKIKEAKTKVNHDEFETVSTYLLTNPDFEDGTNGWTIEKVSGGNVVHGGNSNNHCFEGWNNANYDIYQIVKDAPEGVYRIEVQGFYRYGRGHYPDYKAQEVSYVKPGGAPVFVYMNGKKTPFTNIYGDEKQIEDAAFYGSGYEDVPVDDDRNQVDANEATGHLYFPNDMATAATAFNAGMYKQSAYGIIRAGQEMRIGVKGNSTQLGDSWCIWDNFQLFNCGKDETALNTVLPDEIANAKSMLLNEDASNKLMGKDIRTTLEKAIADAEAALGKSGEVMFDALNDLFDAEENVNASVELFASLQAANDKLLIAVETYSDSPAADEAYALYEEILTGLTTFKYNDSDVPGLIEKINIIMTKLRLPNVEGASADNPIDISAVINHPCYGDEENGAGVASSDGWAGTPVGTNADYFNAEIFSVTPFDHYQEIAGLPAGAYRVTMKGFYRYGGDGPAPDYAAYTENPTANDYAKLYATTDAGSWSTALHRLASFASDIHAGETDWAEVVEGSNLWVPNMMSTASTLFEEQGTAIDNTILVALGEGKTLRLGLKKDEGVEKDWCIFDTWTLEYLGTDTSIVPAPGEGETIEGDVNGDNTVDVADISTILTVMSGDETNFSVQQADVNKDGKADVADISATLTIMAGGKVGDAESTARRATRADNEVTVFTAEDVKTAEDGSFDLVVKMDFETTQTLVGWNLNVMLPEGVVFNTEKQTLGQQKKCVILSEEIHPTYNYDPEIDDDVDYQSMLDFKKRVDGGYQLVWIDDNKCPLVSTHGQLLTIKLKAENPAMTGTGKIYGIGLSNNKDQGFATFGGGATIADVEFSINGGGDSDGIQDVKVAGSKSAVYNLSGQRVNGQAKGLLIQDGKKFIVK